MKAPNAKQCAVCGVAIRSDTSALSLPLRRDNPGYRFDIRLPLHTRRSHPGMHDRGNVVAICGDECMTRAAKRNAEGQALSDEWHAQREIKAVARRRLRDGLAEGQRRTTCEWCGEVFPKQRSTARYCCDACRAKARRARCS